MKRILILMSLVALGAITFQGMVKNKPEQVGQWSYYSHWKNGPFEVRTYEKVIMASVEHEGNIEGSRRNAFQDLAGYIFGGNESDQKIAMTSPVLMNEQEGSMAMRFVMPNEYDMNELPRPNDDKVIIAEMTGFTAVSVAFDGFASPSDYDEQTKVLLEWCQQNGLDVIGEPIYLGYDPPFKLTDRLNEVIVEIDPRSIN